MVLKPLNLWQFVIMEVKRSGKVKEREIYERSNFLENLLLCACFMRIGKNYAWGGPGKEKLVENQWQQQKGGE